MLKLKQKGAFEHKLKGIKPYKFGFTNKKRCHGPTRTFTGEILNLHFAAN